MNNNIDDVGFLSALMDTLMADYSIDTNRIYATGLSNGAFMSYRLACEESNKIAAIAPVAGSMNVNICNPERKVPVIHFHSYQDDHVPLEGGVGSGPSKHYNPPLDSVLNVWSGFNNCTIHNDTLHHYTNYTHINWHDCDCGNELNLYLTQDGGHSWPEGVATATGDPVSTAINANDVMWDFFQQHNLNCTVSGTYALDDNNDILKVYPNPFNNAATVELNKEIGNCEIVICNVSGQKVKTIQNIDKNKFILHSDQLPDGLYFLHLVKNGVIISTNKIIISD